MTRRHRRKLSTLCLVAACGGSSTGPRGNEDASVVPVLPDGGGDGTVLGMANGQPFLHVRTAYWIGAPDSAATTVVYLLSSPVACRDLQTPGWDGRITDGTQILEMKLFGTTAPATFTVTTSPTPAPGEASANDTLSSTTGTPAETSASGGIVRLSSLSSSTSAVGTFQLAYAGGGSLMGDFQAVFCPGGHEP